MANDSDIDVLYTLINQSPDGYIEFYPQKEGEIALKKWPFLASISISGINRPNQPIQLKTSVNILTLPIIKSQDLIENEDSELTSVFNQEQDANKVEIPETSTDNTNEKTFSVPQVQLFEKELSSPVLNLLTNLDSIASKNEGISNAFQFTSASNSLVDTQNSQIASLFKRLEKK